MPPGPRPTWPGPCGGDAGGSHNGGRRAPCHHGADAAQVHERPGGRITTVRLTSGPSMVLVGPQGAADPRVNDDIKPMLAATTPTPIAANSGRKLLGAALHLRHLGQAALMKARSPPGTPTSSCQQWQRQMGGHGALLRPTLPGGGGGA